MIKITTPKDIIWKNIEENGNVSEIIDSINQQLLNISSLDKKGIEIIVVTKEMISYKDLSLIKFAFKEFGWNLSINYKFVEKEKMFYNMMFLTSLIPLI